MTSQQSTVNTSEAESTQSRDAWDALPLMRWSSAGLGRVPTTSVYISILKAKHAVPGICSL